MNDFVGLTQGVLSRLKAPQNNNGRNESFQTLLRGTYDLGESIIVVGSGTGLGLSYILSPSC